MKKTLKNDDLISLNILNESTILDELKHRYLHNHIYTYIGDILISINPLKPLPIYEKTVSDKFKTCPDNVRTHLPPHVFATAEQCYREMLRTQQSQCILISGESGSGKTETCRYLVEHLLNRTKKYEFCLNEKIQEVNPLLEAFGNAKTRINDNSSRFGKFLELYLQEDGSVVGAKFKEYLLEKSRIVYQNHNESTFHIFYYLIGGLLSQESHSNNKYGCQFDKIKHRYIINTSDFKQKHFSITENKKKFDAIKTSMTTIGFSDEDIESVTRILISILLIGDIEFKNHNHNDGVEISNLKNIEKISELLELETDVLRDTLISDVQFTRGEEIRRERNMIQACDVRDAFAKALYGRLFSWIVNQINHHIQPVEGMTPSYSIGLLDIFGFENFENNSFEQICINLANEQLHQLFTKYIFKLEIEECLEEQIEMTDSDFVSYQDNQIILDIFLDKRNSIFSILDEVNRFPQANDETLALKLHQSLAQTYSNVYKAPKNGGTSFLIKHYAGEVSYNVVGFIEKNRDFLPNNLFSLARTSNDVVIQELFECKLTRKGTLAPSDRQSKLRKSLRRHFENKNLQYTTTVEQETVTHLPNNKSKMQHVKFIGDNTVTSSINNNILNDKALPLTVTSHFKNSLNELIEKISASKSYFIRCIKPNSKQENVFNDAFVAKQLRYCSLMHVCKIRKCGYPYRVKFDEFLKWYKSIEMCIIKEPCELNSVQRCIKCLKHAKITDYKIGKTKIFLRYWHLDILNDVSKKLLNKILITEKICKGWLARKRVKQIRYKKQQELEYRKQIEMAKNELNTRFNDVSNINHNGRNLPDLNEIDSALEQFDEMLDAYSDDSDSINRKNESFKENSKSQENTKVQRPQSAVTPSAVYHLVNNSNNKNDNTLKRKNALVAFEFKKILSEANDGSTQQSQSQHPPQQLKSTSPDLKSLPNTHKMSSIHLNVNTRSINHTLPPPVRGENVKKTENNDIHQDHQNITIWREELNTKANIEIKIKKEIEYVQKIEDSKKQIPEWKRNLIKQIEIKNKSKTSITTTTSGLIENHLNGLSHHNAYMNMHNDEETPELMKHNIFLKKSLATISS